MCPPAPDPHAKCSPMHQVHQGRNGRTVLDQAISSLGIAQAPNLTDSTDLLMEMIMLTGSGSFSFNLPNMQQEPEPLPPLPIVHKQTMSFLLHVSYGPSLHLLWQLWGKDQRQYFSPLIKSKKPAPDRRAIQDEDQSG